MLGWLEPPRCGWVLRMIGSDLQIDLPKNKAPRRASDDQKSLFETHGIFESQGNRHCFLFIVYLHFFLNKMSSLFLFFHIHWEEMRCGFFGWLLFFSGRLFVMCLLFKSTFNLTESFSAAVCSCVATSTFGWGCPSGDYC